jgi:hypothetical protein
MKRELIVGVVAYVAMMLVAVIYGIGGWAAEVGSFLSGASTVALGFWGWDVGARARKTEFRWYRRIFRRKPTMPKAESKLKSCACTPLCQPCRQSFRALKQLDEDEHKMMRGRLLRLEGENKLLRRCVEFADKHMSRFQFSTVGDKWKYLRRDVCKATPVEDPEVVDENLGGKPDVSPNLNQNLPETET